MSLQLNGTDGVTFNDGSEQWAAASPIGTKNLIINGDMRIAQRGTSATGISNSNTYYTIDRYQVDCGTGPVWSQEQSTDVPTGQGFGHSLKMSCTTAETPLASGSRLQIRTRLEGQNLQHLKYGTSSAESLTLSFWVKSNKTGTYVFELYNVDATRQVSKSFTINSADTWEKKTITYDGDTVSGFDNDNGNSLQIGIYFAAGSNYSSGTQQTTWASAVTANRAAALTVNLADSTSNYINITGVQLEVGDTATPFEVMPYDMQLARCQRYYQKYTANFDEPLCNGTYYTTTLVYGVMNFNTTMRAKPTGSVSSQTAFRLLGQGGAKTSTAAGIGQRTVNSGEITSTVSAGTAGYSGWIRGSTAMYVDFDAEL